MAKGCPCISDRMLRTERTSGIRAFTLRKRWPRVDLLRPSDPRNHRAKTRLCDPDSCHGVSSPTWTGFLRPFFPQPRHHAKGRAWQPDRSRSEEHTSELQSHSDLVCRLLLEKKKKQQTI